MTYICEDCGFLFSRVSEIKWCPSCDGAKIRYATEKEQEILKNYLNKQIKQVGEQSK